MEDVIEELKMSIMKLQQINTLRIIKIEYEMLTLKQMVFKDLAEKLGGEVSEVESIHESYTHVALLAHYEKLLPTLNYLDEAEIKQHLGIQD